MSLFQNKLHDHVQEAISVYFFSLILIYVDVKIFWCKPTAERLYIYVFFSSINKRNVKSRTYGSKMTDNQFGRIKSKLENSKQDLWCPWKSYHRRCGQETLIVSDNHISFIWKLKSDNHITAKDIWFEMIWWKMMKLSMFFYLTYLVLPTGPNINSIFCSKVKFNKSLICEKSQPLIYITLSI